MAKIDIFIQKPVILLSYFSNFIILHKKQRKKLWKPLNLQENVILEFYTKTREFFFFQIHVPGYMEFWFFFKSMYPGTWIEFFFFF